MKAAANTFHQRLGRGYEVEDEGQQTLLVKGKPEIEVTCGNVRAPSLGCGGRRPGKPEGRCSELDIGDLHGALPTDTAAEQAHRGHSLCLRKRFRARGARRWPHPEPLLEDPEDAPSSWSQAAGFQKGGPGRGELAEIGEQHGGAGGWPPGAHDGDGGNAAAESRVRISEMRPGEGAGVSS